MGFFTFLALIIIAYYAFQAYEKKNDSDLKFKTKELELKERELEASLGITKKIKYKHYKGGIYELIGEGKHTETEEDLVFYQDEEGNLWARPVDMFKETVEVNGETVERFKKLD